jgi:hypothetical protein
MLALVQAAFEVRGGRSATGAFISLSWSCSSNAMIRGGGGVADRSRKNRRRSPTSSQIARVWTSLQVQESEFDIIPTSFRGSWAVVTVQSIKARRSSRGTLKLGLFASKQCYCGASGNNNPNKFSANNARGSAVLLRLFELGFRSGAD